MNAYKALRCVCAHIICLVLCSLVPMTFLITPAAWAQGGPTLEIVYVDSSASGVTEDGASWATAFRFLQDGLVKADEHLDPTTGGADAVEIWVAAGTYKPHLSQANPSGEDIECGDGCE